MDGDGAVVVLELRATAVLVVLKLPPSMDEGCLVLDDFSFGSIVLLISIFAESVVDIDVTCWACPVLLGVTNSVVVSGSPFFAESDVDEEGSAVLLELVTSPFK